MASATLDPTQAAGVRDALSDAIATMQGVDVQTVDVLVSDLQCAGGTMRLTAMASEPIAELTISCQTAQGWTTSWGEMNRQQLQALGAAVNEALETMPGELSDN